ncbi:MAG: ATP-binding protein [Elusimicrobiota bacterium]
MKTNVTLPGESGPGEPGKGQTKPPVHVDFGKQESKDASPFQKAKTMPKRLKALIWGPSGAGKTTMCLQAPKPGVLDLEGGCDLYGDSFEFSVLRASTADEAMAAVDWLLTHKHDLRTLVVDPISVFWDALQKKWSDVFLQRNKGSKGYKFEFYDLQPKDWLTIKGEFKEFVRKLIALDMNVLVTAREKTQYADGAYMKAIGETFDGEKSLPYLFDVIIRMYVDEKGRHMCACLKDRTNKLPKEPFEAKFATFEALLGKQALTRKAKPMTLASQEQKDRIGTLIAQVGVTPEQVSRRLAAYEAETIDDLTAENAAIIIQKLEAAASKKA